MFTDAPQYVAALLQRHDAERVYSAGLKLLGFPPTWEISYDECLAIEAELTSKRT